MTPVLGAGQAHAGRQGNQIAEQGSWQVPARHSPALQSAWLSQFGAQI
jgi:hypothetical protein